MLTEGGRESTDQRFFPRDESAQFFVLGILRALTHFTKSLNLNERQVCPFAATNGSDDQWELSKNKAAIQTEDLSGHGGPFV